MKQLFNTFLMFITSSIFIYSQNPHEIVKKMSLELKKIESLQCELINSYIQNTDTTINKIKGSFIFYTSLKRKPLPQYFAQTQITQNDTSNVNHEIVYNRKLYMIKDKTKEILIDTLKKNEISDYWNRLQQNFGVFFFDSTLLYLDSMFQSKYINANENLKQIKYSLTRDKNCMSGDCFKITFSHPSDIGAEVKDNPDSVIWFKDVVVNYWINTKTYLPERYSYVFTLENNEPYIINDLRYTKFIVNPSISISEVSFVQSNYPNYRIEKFTSKGYKTIQEAFKKAPDFEGITQNGDSIHLYDNHAKLYLIDFWFTNCYPCLEVKKFIETKIIPRYSSEKVMIIGINPINKSFDEIKKILKEKEPKYPYILNKELAKEYHLSVYPGIYLLNSDFEVIQSWNNFDLKKGKIILDLIKANLK